MAARAVVVLAVVLVVAVAPSAPSAQAAGPGVGRPVAPPSEAAVPQAAPPSEGASPSPAEPPAVQDAVGRPVRLREPAPDVRIRGSGWGHSVGMSQYGAYAQALKGWSAGRILRHWYSGVTVGRTDAARRPIVVNVSTAAQSPAIAITSGAAQWQVCAATCRRLTGAAGQRLTQRPADGAWAVTATSSELRVHDGDRVLWRGAPGVRLRVVLSHGSGERTIARVLGRRYRWGVLELGMHGDACNAPRLCVNVRVPTVEHYLYGLAEMPSSWARAALSAQAIVGRTYALRTLEHGLRDSCACHLLSTPADQAYVGLEKEDGPSGDRWVAAVDASAGRVVRYRGALAATFYASSHGGRSERVSDSYAYSAPLEDYPYLDSVNDPYSADPAVRNPYARWTVTVDNARFARYVDRRLRRVTGVRILSRTHGGTPRTLRVTGVDADGRELTVDFSGNAGKPVGSRRVFIVGAEMKTRFDLRSQQITRIGLGPFSDDDGNTHEQAIAKLAVNGVTTGCADDRFCPSERVTRAQTASLLARALQLTPAAADAFTDDDGSVHEGAINALAATGVTQGCTPTTFCPGDRLTRAQMASLLARAFALPPAASDAFDDDDASVHEDAINRLAAAGITTGTADGGFDPSGAVTRAQLASFLVRALDRV